MYNLQVLWFTGSQNMNLNNKYGNVTYTLRFQLAMDRYKKKKAKFYYVDQKATLAHMTTRIILTDKDCGDSLKEVDVQKFGAPLKYKMANKCWTAVNKCGNDNTIKVHELILGFDVDNCKDLKWFYDLCHVSVNNHSEANNLTHYKEVFKCLTVVKEGICCRYPYNENETKEIIIQRCPKLADMIDSSDFTNLDWILTGEKNKSTFCGKNSASNKYGMAKSVECISISKCSSRKVRKFSPNHAEIPIQKDVSYAIRSNNISSPATAPLQFLEEESIVENSKEQPKIASRTYDWDLEQILKEFDEVCFSDGNESDASSLSNRSVIHLDDICSGDESESTVHSLSPRSKKLHHRYRRRRRVVTTPRFDV